MNFLVRVVPVLLFLTAVCGRAELLKNELVSVLVDDFAQRITSFQTVEGSKHYYSDNNHFLLHQKAPSRNYLTVRIDGKPYKFGLTGRKRVVMRRTGDSLYSENDLSGLIAGQRIELVNGLTSGLPDNIRLTFTVRNDDTAPHEVGLRYLIDTFNGLSDDAPFYLPSVGAVPGEREIRDIPDYLFTTDDITEPFNLFEVVFARNVPARPDRIVLANCDKLNDEPWAFEPAVSPSFRQGENAMSDSAAALYWDPKTLDPGVTLTAVFEMGVYDSRYFKGDVVELAMGIPQPVPDSRLIAVSVLMKNSDGFRPLSDIKPSLSLPEGVTVAADNVFGSISEIQPKSGHFIYYYLNFGDATEGKYDLRLNTTGRIGKNFTINDFIQSFAVGPK